MHLRAKLLIAAAGCTVLLSTPAAADHQWGNYHWARSSNPLQLSIERQLTSNWVTHFNTAVGDWDVSTVLALTAATQNAGVSPKQCSPLSGKVLVCNDAYGLRGWLGIASIWANGDHITQGTTKVNDSYFNTATYNTAAWRLMVMCQEIGHDFGLDHQDDNFDNANLGTCMDYTSDPSTNQRPNTHDYNQLETMYSHLDGAGGGGGGTCNPRSPKCNSGQSDAFTFREVGKPAPSASSVSSADWGRAIAFDGAGRPDTFLLDLGNGRSKITHVFWVPGHRPTPAEMHD